MDGQLVRLTAADYEEALDFMNMVFSMNRRPANFLTGLPIMWERDDEHMGKHWAVKREGRIRAMLGVYPLPVVIAGMKLLFSTVGNVCTSRYEEGKGYMAALMALAMEELERQGMDASRLGGLRHRYTRFGYEAAGSVYHFTLTQHNLLRVPVDTAGIAFRRIEENDAEALDFARSLFEKQGIAVVRPGRTGFYKTLRAWQNTPYLALNAQRQPIGYLTAGKHGVAEQDAVSPEALVVLLAAWLEQQQLEALRFTLSPWQRREAIACEKICEDWFISSPCRYKIIHWAEVLDALMQLKASVTRLPQGEFVLNIQGYGNLELAVTSAGAHCAKTDRAAEMRVDPLTATRLLCGPAPAFFAAELPMEKSLLLNSWLPLPLGWNTLDRV